MTALHVAVLADDATAVRTLTRAGFVVTITTDPVSFRNDMPAAHAAVVIRSEVQDEHLPDPLRDEHAPPVIVVSPLPFEGAVRQLRHQFLIREILSPHESHRLLVRTVADAALGDVIERVRRGLVQCEIEADHRLGAALLKALETPMLSVEAMAAAAGLGRKAYDKRWKKTFDTGPTAKTFLRGQLLLRAIRIRVRDPNREWVRIARTLAITPDRLRDISRDLTGVVPSDLDLYGSPAVIIANVCALTLPPHLLRQTSRAVAVRLMSE